VEDNRKQAGQGIVPVNHPACPQTTVSINNPQDITREVLNFLPQEQAEGLAKTVAAELLRLQVQQAESQQDRIEVEQKIDNAIRVMGDADRSRGTEVNFQTEHKTAKGTTRISVHSRPAAHPIQVAPPGRQASGSCFVATVCYGDYDHPTVLVLRRFRDLTLVHSMAGRAFVAFYYRHGPCLARQIERLPMLKPPVRLILGVFAMTYNQLYIDYDT
jgi:hypothetical protein